jgi:uncharacterized protein YukE
MVFGKFFKNVKNTFNKLKNLDKKIKDERKEIFKILTELQNNLQKQKFIAEELCKESTYRTILGDNLSEEFCELQGIIDSMLNLVYQERVRISKEIGLLDKVLKIYDEEKMKNINNQQVFNQIRGNEMAIAKALQSAYYSEVMGEKIPNQIINLHIQKKRNINAIKGFTRNNIKNSVINKKIKELVSLTKEEDKLLSKIKGGELKEKIELEEEIMDLKALENFNVLKEYEIQQMQNEIKVKENNLREEQKELKTNIEDLRKFLEDITKNINELIKFIKTVGEFPDDIRKLEEDINDLSKNIQNLIELLNKWLSQIIGQPKRSENTANLINKPNAKDILNDLLKELQDAETVLKNIENSLGKIDRDIKEIANKIGNLVGIKRKQLLEEIVRKISSAINTGKNIIRKIRTHISNIITAINALIGLIDFFRRLLGSTNQGQTHTNPR